MSAEQLEVVELEEPVVRHRARSGRRPIGVLLAPLALALGAGIGSHATHAAPPRSNHTAVPLPFVTCGTVPPTPEVSLDA